MQAPDIFDQTDFRRYLETWFEWRKANNRRYSHRQFARRLGTNDPSVLLNILKGRRKLAARQVEDFVRVLGLDEDGAAYFRVLVRHGQADDERARDRAWAEIVELRSRLKKPEVDASRLKYLSHRTYPIVQALAQCEGFEPDPAWIGAHVLPPITPEDAAEAVALLERLGFFVRDGDRIVVHEPMLRTATTVEAIGTHDWHAESMDYARQQLELIRLHTRTVEKETGFVGATIAIPQERIEELRALVYEHLSQIVRHTEQWAGLDRVVQINVQMIPVSTPTRA